MLEAKEGYRNTGTPTARHGRGRVTHAVVYRMPWQSIPHELRFILQRQQRVSNDVRYLSVRNWPHLYRATLVCYIPLGEDTSNSLT